MATLTGPREYYFECGWGSPPWYIVRIRNLREYLRKTESLVASCQFMLD